MWGIEQVVGRGDREILRIAAAQRGLVLREQLLAAGIGRGAIAHRVKSGRLHVRYPGVYLLGRSTIEPLGEELAAVLYFRGHAILSHRTAAGVWGFANRLPGEDLVLTIVGIDRRPRPGLMVRRTAGLNRRDLRARHGLPLTSPARTLLDLAGTGSDDDELEQAIAEAQVLGLVREGEISATLERARGRPGVPRVRRLLDADGGPAFTRSKAERRMVRLVRAADLPRPLVNVPLLGYVADLLWPQKRLVVEVDGHAYHSGRAAFERDRRRDQRFVAAGYRVVRVTWRQLQYEPLAVIGRVAQALAHTP